MSKQALMLKELAKNENSQILKQAIQSAAKAVEERVYWLNTSEIEGDFLQQYWDKQVTANHILKKRIQQITQQKFDELFAEIDKGKISPEHELEVFHIGNLNLSALAQQIPFYDNSYFSQDHPKTKQTKAKLRQIQTDYQKFKEKIQEIKRKQQEKKRQKAAAQQQLRQSQQKEKKQRYRELVMKTIQQKSKKQQQRKIQNQKFKQYLKMYKGSKPLHVLMEEQYKQKFQLPMIEQNKRKLQEYKQKVKPTLQQINDHERSYMQAKQQRQRESRIYMPNKTIDVSFKSKFYLAEQQKMGGGDQAYETLFDQMEKKKRYSQLVKQNFKPKISARLRNSVNQSQMKKTSAKQGLDRTAQIQQGKVYLQFMRSLQKNRKQHSSPSQRGQAEPQHRYVNYLQMLKQSRQVQGNESRISNDWERDARNKSLSEYERRERILMKSKQLQQKAQRKEQFVNNFNYGKAEEIIQRKKQIDDTLISSIRAKVAVLKEAHEI